MSRSEIFVASKDQALKVHEMDQAGELPADIIRVSSLSIVKEKFEGFSPQHRLSKSNLNNIDLNEVALALAQNWVSNDEVSDEVLEELERKRGEYQNNKSRDKKETLWSDWGAENLDEKSSEKTPLS